MMRRTDKAWWMADETQLHVACIAAMREADQYGREIARQAAMQRFDSMYEPTRSGNFSDGLLHLNVTQSVIDTAAAQIAGQRTNVMVLTRQGDEKLRKQAKKLTMFLEGLAESVGHHDVAAQVFIDGCIFGTGIERIGVLGDSVTVQRVDPRAVLVAPSDWTHASPRQLFEIEALPLHEAMARYPEESQEMLLTSSQSLRERDNDTSSNGNEHCGDTVYLLHAWKLPSTSSMSRNDAAITERDRGRYCCVTTAGVLADEEYQSPELPHAFFHWSRTPATFWGYGLCARLASVQKELDALTWKIQESMRLCSTSVWFKKGSAADKAKFSNQIMPKYEYTTQPPITIAPPPLDASYFQQVERLYQRAFDLTGISPMAAQGMKPAGINSGKALRLYKDVTAQRQTLQGTAYDQLAVDAANRMMTAAAEIDAAGRGSFRIMAKTGDALTDIRWKEVRLPENAYRLQRSPISYLSSQPGSKLDDIQEMLQAFPELRPFALRAINFPDLEEFQALATSRYDEITRCLSSILDDGKYMGPESQTDLEMAGPLALATLRRARANNADPDRQDMLRDYILALDSLKKSALQQAAMPTPPGAAPMPGAPPVDPSMMPPPGAPPMPQ